MRTTVTSPSSPQALDLLLDMLTLPSLGCSVCLGVWGHLLSGHVLPLAGVYSQGLDGLQRGKESLADGLQLVVIEGEQVEVLQVLKCVHAQTVDLVGIEEAASRREASDSVILPLPCGARLCPQVTGYRLCVRLTATAPAAESGWWGLGGCSCIPVAPGTPHTSGHLYTT